MRARSDVCRCPGSGQECASVRLDLPRPTRLLLWLPTAAALAACAATVVSSGAAARPETAGVVALAHPTAVLPLGDNQYQCGGSAAFSRAYAPTWGRFLGISHPVPGNADYGEGETSGFKPTCSPGSPGASYFGYFGARAGD